MPSLFRRREEPVVAAAEAEVRAWRLQFLHVANAVGQVAVQAVENLHGGLAVDGAEIGAGFRGPDDGDSLGRGVLAHLVSPNSRRISS